MELMKRFHLASPVRIQSWKEKQDVQDVMEVWSSTSWTSLLVGFLDKWKLVFWTIT